MAALPDWVRWTATAAAGLDIQIDVAGTTLSATQDSASLDPDLWDALFPSDTAVAGYAMPNLDRSLILSYPSGILLSAVAHTYGRAATEPGGLNSRTWASLIGDYQWPPPDVSVAEALARVRASAWQQQLADSDPGLLRAGAWTFGPIQPGVIEGGVGAFHLYSRPEPSVRGLPTPEQLSASYDLHAGLGAIRSYPALARRLGLVIDVRLDISGLPPIPATGTLNVAALNPSGEWRSAAQLFQPATQYEYRPDEPGAFSTASDPAVIGDLDGGFVRLRNGFAIDQVELDSAMMSLAAASRVPADSAGLPALRSGGIQLFNNDRAGCLRRTLLRNRALEDILAGSSDVAAPTLRAVDVVQGYRVDIWNSASQRWHSLHRRDAQYTAGTDPVVTFLDKAEEGYLHLAVRQSPQESGNDGDNAGDGGDPTEPPPPRSDVYVHERIARWTGWSLSASRPFSPLNRSADPARATELESQGDQIHGIPLQTAFTVTPGTLPRLRFGQCYRIRLRAVDLAGNSPALEETEPKESALPAEPTGLLYRRLEPLPAPVLVPKTNLVDEKGATLTRLVIRSYNATDDLDNQATGEVAQRHVLPPRGSIELAERHGKLDIENGLDSSPDVYNMLAERDAAELPGDPNPLASEDHLPTPYLPDPLASRVVLADPPGLAPGIVQDVDDTTQVPGIDPDAYPRSALTLVSFSGQWPALDGIRLDLAEGFDAPSWNVQARVLTVYLAKATVRDVELTTGFSPELLATLGLEGFIQQTQEAEQARLRADNSQDPDLGRHLVGVASKLGMLTQMCLDARHPMLTPPRRLTLVHAVQRPLADPRLVGLESGMPWHNPSSLRSEQPLGFRPLRAWRQEGSVDTQFLGALLIHGASTGRVDVHAQWSEQIDDPTSPLPTATHHESLCDPLQLDSLDDALLRPLSPGGEPPGRYLPDQDLIWMADVGDILGPHEATSRHTLRHAIGDTRHHVVTYRPVATSRFADCFADGVDLTRSGPSQVIDVPASERPAPPNIRYVTPALAWERTRTAASTTSLRLGGLVRIYLERPWLSSGDGELLGICLWPADQPAPDDAVRRDHGTRFSQWGLDPLWPTRPEPEAVVATDHLPRAAITRTGLVLPDGERVDVAGHEVKYAADRQLWFSDVEIRLPITYSPFVRLSVCRLQPHAITNCELSSAVATDVVQLLSERSVSRMTDPSNPTRHRITVSGVSPRPPRATQVTVKAQERDPNLSGELAWRDVTGVVDILPDATPVPGDTLLWSGSVVCHAPSKQIRVVIREDEVFEADPGAPQIQNESERGRTLSGGSLQREASTAAPLVPLMRVSEPARPTSRRERADHVSLSPPVRPSFGYRPVFLETLVFWAGAEAPLGQTAADDPPDMPDPATPFDVPPYPPIPDFLPSPGPTLLPQSMDAAGVGAIVLLQALLNAAVPGAGLKLNGVADPMTTAALDSFRFAEGLPAGSELEPVLWTHLLAFVPHTTLEPGDGSEPMAGPPVHTIQELLNTSDLAPDVPVTGALDEATTSAIREYQDVVGLAATGVVDQETWRSIEMIPMNLAPQGVLATSWTIDLSQDIPAHLNASDPVADVEVPSDTLTDLTGSAGWWIEWRNLHDSVIWRRFLHDPFSLDVEVFTSEDEGLFIRAARPATSTASILVPDLPTGATLVMVGSLGDVPAVEVGRSTRQEMVQP